MCYILNIETATTVCSASVSKNGEVLALRELDNGFTHAENLHIFIDSVLKEAGIRPTELNSIAVSKGPGSYTGLRIGASTAKGMAYALNIPLISVDTLQIMASQAQLMQNEQAAMYCGMIDARRMEVYAAIYDQELRPVRATEALIVTEDSIEQFNAYTKIFFFGDGMPKCKELLGSLKNALFIDDVKPSARHMSALSFERYSNRQFEDVAYFEPFYLKDFMIKKKAER